VVSTKAISVVAKDALELPLVQRLTLARIRLDLSDDSQDFSFDVEAGRARSAGFDEVFARLHRRFPA
jgi:hypothetical protein